MGEHQIPLKRRLNQFQHPQPPARPWLCTVDRGQELPRHWHVDAALLTRSPNLLVASSNGAGWDTIDVEACTASGVLAVNQAGGNREAVAEHVMALMLTLSKRIGEADHFMRREANISRVAYKGHDVLGRTIGIIGLGHVGSRVAELCRGLFRMRVLVYDPYLPEPGASPAPGWMIGTMSRRGRIIRCWRSTTCWAARILAA